MGPPNPSLLSNSRDVPPPRAFRGTCENNPPPLEKCPKRRKITPVAGVAPEAKPSTNLIVVGLRHLVHWYSTHSSHSLYYILSIRPGGRKARCRACPLRFAVLAVRVPRRDFGSASREKGAKKSARCRRCERARLWRWCTSARGAPFFSRRRGDRRRRARRGDAKGWASLTCIFPLRTERGLSRTTRTVHSRLMCVRKTRRGNPPIRGHETARRAWWNMRESAAKICESWATLAPRAANLGTCAGMRDFELCMEGGRERAFFEGGIMGNCYFDSLQVEE